MMSLKKIRLGFILLLPVFISGCYSVKEIDKLTCLKIKDADSYIRKMYMVKTKYDGQKLVSKDSLTTYSDSILSEVQYLFIKNDIVIYLTTTPSKYIYDKTDSYLIGSKFPNAYYLNAMYVGKVEEKGPNTMNFFFEGKKTNQRWEMTRTANGWHLQSLDEIKFRMHKKQPGGESIKRISNTIVMKPKNSFLHAVEFESVPNFRFRYRKPLGHGSYDLSGLLKPKLAAKTNTGLYAKCICLSLEGSRKESINYGVMFFDFETYKLFAADHVPFYRNWSSEKLTLEDMEEEN